jgi:hypothetical protein
MKTQIRAALVLLTGASQVNAQSEKFERFEYFAPLPKRGDVSAHWLSSKNFNPDATVASNGVTTSIVAVPLPKPNPIKRHR